MLVLLKIHLDNHVKSVHDQIKDEACEKCHKKIWKQDITQAYVENQKSFYVINVPNAF